MRRTKTLLVLVLVPLLLLASWLLKQDVWYPVQAFAFSEDGTKLWTLHLTRRGWSPGTIKIWDLRTGSQLRERPGIDSASLVVSSDEQMLVTGGWNRGLRFWDARTLEEIPMPITGKPRMAPVALRGERLLVQSSYPSRLEVLSLKTGDVLDVLEPTLPRDFSDFVISRDEGTLAIRYYSTGKPIPPTATLVYREVDGRYQLLHYWEATPRALSPQGEHILVIPDGSGNSMLPILECRRVSDGKALWKTPAPHNLSCAFLFDSDGVAISDTLGNVEVRDAATGKLLSRWSSANWTYLGELGRVPRNDLWLGNRLVMQEPGDTIGRGPIQVLDLTSGKPFITLPMEQGRYLALLIGSLLLVAVWCVTWAMHRSRAPGFEPLLDAGVIHAVILFLLLVRILTAESSQHLLAPVTWLLLGQVAALTCLAVICTLFGPQRLLIRVAACTTFFALASAGMIAGWTGDDVFIWHVVIGATSLLICFTGLVLLLKQLGWSIASPRNFRQARGRNSVQFPLRDLMVLAAAFGGFFAAARFFVPSMLPMWMWLYLFLEGFAFALLASMALWAMLGKSSSLLPCGVFWAFALSSFVIAYGPFRGQNLLPWWWYVAVRGIAAAHMMWTLYVFRRYGYRFVKIEPRRQIA